MSQDGRSSRVAITGASGFLGSTLSRSLKGDGVEVVRLVRRKATGPDEIEWHPDRQFIDSGRLEGLDAVVNLAGETIAGIWTPGKKRRIRESRVAGTQLLAIALAGLERPPRVLVSASGVGYYGDAGDTLLTEDASPGDDFLANVCRDWEGATRPAADAGIRVVNPRFGLILDRSGGVLRLMLPAFQLGLGGRLGDGRQWLSWIALADAIRAIRLALDTDGLHGAVNAVAPEPIRNRDFTEQLGKALHRPTFLILPAPILRAVTGGMGEALLLASQRAVPGRLSGLGLSFHAPSFPAFVANGLDGSV